MVTSPPSPPSFEALEQKVGYRFVDPRLCEQALTHESWLNENPGSGRAGNERLEFLGDAVLSLVVSDLLMRKFAECHEGELSKLRAVVVNEIGLEAVASRLDLGQWIFLGRGEERAGGRTRKSIVADALEALVGAVYVDGGFDAARHVIESLFAQRLDQAQGETDLDYKSRLQEHSQARLKLTPRYHDVGQSGPEHDKLFEVAIHIGDREIARATGRSKKAAQQAAAAEALARLAAEPGRRNQV